MRQMPVVRRPRRYSLGDWRVIGRIQTLDLPSGGRVETPLLVPSVSSRGFDWYEADGLQLSTVSLSLENTRR
jgi:hypothetical protein